MSEANNQTNSSYQTINPDCWIIFTSSMVHNNNGNILLGFYVLSMLLITTTNIAMIVGLIKCFRKLSRINKLFIFLSLNDLMVGILLIPIQIYGVISGDKTSCTGAGVHGFLTVYAPSVSMTTVCLIALDRYMLISNKIFYENYLTSCFVTIWIIGELTIVIIGSLWYAISLQYQNLVVHGLLMLFLSTFVGIALGSVTVINIKLLRHVKQAAKESQQTFSFGTTRYEKKVTKTIIVISIILVICYLPTLIGLLYNSIFYFKPGNKIMRKKTNNIQQLLPWLTCLVELHSFLNASVFIWRNRIIVNYYKVMFHISVAPSTSSRNTASVSSTTQVIKCNQL